MPDILSAQERSRVMSRIRTRDTKPEVQVRRVLHALGFRFRLDVRRLPGRPDIVLPKYSAVIFVNGCFWHGHGCHRFRWPGTREEFWRNKIGDTKVRDKDNFESLQSEGWRVFTVWECALRGRDALGADIVGHLLKEWLHGGRSAGVISGSESAVLQSGLLEEAS